MCLVIHSTVPRNGTTTSTRGFPYKRIPTSSSQELLISREGAPLPQQQPDMAVLDLNWDGEATVQSNGSQTLASFRITRRDLLKYRLVFPNPTGSDSVGLEWGPRICSSKSSLVILLLLVWVPLLENHCSRTRLMWQRLATGGC